LRNIWNKFKKHKF